MIYDGLNHALKLEADWINVVEIVSAEEGMAQGL